MEQAIIALDDALDDYRRHVDLADVTEERTAPGTRTSRLGGAGHVGLRSRYSPVIGIDNPLDKR